MSGFVRAFVALKVPADVAAALGAFTRSLATKLAGQGIRWVREDQLHLTLYFLGNVPCDRLPPLEQGLRRRLDGRPGLQLRAQGLGAFPGLRAPRVLWVGLDGELAELGDLQGCVQAACRDGGLGREDYPFHAHLTLGRARAAGARRVGALGDELSTVQAGVFGAWRAAEVHLIRSEPTPAGSSYSQLAVFPLGREPHRSGCASAGGLPA